ncbi:hypothetical protein ACKLNR_008721 [Fusarium oxysporum f. sp. zingiberi]
MACSDPLARFFTWVIIRDLLPAAEVLMPSESRPQTRSVRNQFCIWCQVGVVWSIVLSLQSMPRAFSPANDLVFSPG